jgi:hypothetical protein
MVLNPGRKQLDGVMVIEGVLSRSDALQILLEAPGWFRIG